jgi:GTP-binding protein
MKSDFLRNIGIVAHVDHGKTTLVDALLRYSGSLKLTRDVVERERVMDSNALERERGITILSKNTSVEWQNYRINIVDTPGHADFSGEVERILSMVDSVLLLIDAVEGPMPQTRFVVQKAFANKLRPLVVINKCDRKGARPDWVVDQTFDLFDKLGATDQQLDFPIAYCSATLGYARPEPNGVETDLRFLFDMIIKHAPRPEVFAGGALQMQISSIDYSPYVGTIGIGKIQRGEMFAGQEIVVVDQNGGKRKTRNSDLIAFNGLARENRKHAVAGEIIGVTGIDGLRVSDTVCHPDKPESLPPLSLDDPTLSMTFEVSDSPFAGREAKFVTSRQILERLEKELIRNVALKIKPTNDPKIVSVFGRGELHLSILIENMRREGYGFCVGKPQVLRKKINEIYHEPYEYLVMDTLAEYQGKVMEMVGERQGVLQNVQQQGGERVKLEFVVPSRSLIGLRTEYLSTTSGHGLMSSVFDSYKPSEETRTFNRINGVLISNSPGKALAYSLFGLQNRGRLLVKPGEEIFEGMIIGIHNRNNDLTVNPMKAKQLTNIRAAGNDENLVLTPPLELDLEKALEFISDDELVEVTPSGIRLRKRLLKETDRKTANRSAKRL